VVLTAPKTMQQLEKNLKTLEMGPVSKEEKAWLERIGDHVHARSSSANFDFLFQGRKHSGTR
jgi:hypothetical protein